MIDEHKPYIPASTILPETTVKAFIPGAVLSVILVGILLAVPIVIWERNVFDLGTTLPVAIGFIALLGVCYWLYRSSSKSFRTL